MATILPIRGDSSKLDAIVDLWGENRQWLGPFPRGAFEERAQKGQILAAIEGDSVAGYVLFYFSNRKVRITHLCVAGQHRGKGVAKDLVTALRERTREFYAITLHCRRDFPAWNLWPRLGFVAVAEKVGRSADGHELTLYCLEIRQPPILSQMQDLDEERVDVAVDANVFYDLHDPSRQSAEESCGLQADWLQPQIRLRITEELFNEIQRNEDPKQRKASFGAAKRSIALPATRMTS